MKTGTDPFKILWFLFGSLCLHVGVAVLLAELPTQSLGVSPLPIEIANPESSPTPGKEFSKNHKILQTGQVPALSERGSDFSQEKERTGNQEGSVSSAGESVFSEGRPSAEAKYLSELRQQIEKQKKYPLLAKKMGQSGKVVVRLTLNSQGFVVSSEIIEKSLFPILNEAAVNLIKGLHQLKPFPAEISKDTWEIVVPLEYRL